MPNLPTSYIDEFYPFAQELISVSREIILGYYNTALEVEKKKDDTPVTIADRLAEGAIRDKINRRFPGHGIIGEEWGNEREDSEFVWVIDPIDGTKSFLSGVPLFGTLIALMHHNEPVLGVFHQPVLNQTMVGDGVRTLQNGEPVQNSHFRSLSEARLMTTDIQDIQKHHDLKAFWELMSCVKLTRTWGDCFGYYLLARGNADIMFDPIVSVWDAMAVIPIVRGAGAVVTDVRGGAPDKASSLLAASPAIHEEVLSILNP